MTKLIFSIIPSLLFFSCGTELQPTDPSSSDGKSSSSFSDNTNGEYTPSPVSESDLPDFDNTPIVYVTEVGPVAYSADNKSITYESEQSYCLGSTEGSTWTLVSSVQTTVLHYEIEGDTMLTWTDTRCAAQVYTGKGPSLNGHWNGTGDSGREIPKDRLPEFYDTFCSGENSLLDIMIAVDSLEISNEKFYNRTTTTLCLANSAEAFRKHMDSLGGKLEIDGCNFFTVTQGDKSATASFALRSDSLFVKLEGEGELCASGEKLLPESDADCGNDESLSRCVDERFSWIRPLLTITTDSTYENGGSSTSTIKLF